VGTVQALLPFTQPIPVMTLSWIGVWLLGPQSLDVLDKLRDT